MHEEYITVIECMMEVFYIILLFLIHLFVLLVPLCLKRRRSKFFKSVLSREFSWTDEAHREVLRCAFFLKSYSLQ